MKKEYIKPDIEVIELVVVNEITTNPEDSWGYGELPDGW